MFSEEYKRSSEDGHCENNKTGNSDKSVEQGRWLNYSLPEILNKFDTGLSSEKKLGQAKEKPF